MNDDMKLTLNAVEVLRARYLLKDRNGNVVETPRQMFWRVALNVGMVELVYEFLRGGGIPGRASFTSSLPHRSVN